MLPVFALIGRPNVGKSTLFNCLTHSRDALVYDTPGITRDRLYGQGEFNSQKFLVIDSGGISFDEDAMAHLMLTQSWEAVEEANVVLWLVDAKDGLTAADLQLSERLRELEKPVLLVVNKMDNTAANIASSEFYQLGWPQMLAISALQNKGISDLLIQAFSLLPPMEEEHLPNVDPGIKVAIVGRPNVGKSTLVNRLLGEDRVVVYDEPGTTRDSIFIPFTRRDQPFTIIDTAGVRRKHNITATIEKFSVVKTLKAVAAAHVVIYIINGQESITDQDLHLLRFVIDEGRGLIVAVNKWDGLDEYDRTQVRSQVDRRLTFVEFAELVYISAKHGTGVGDLWKKIMQVYRCVTRKQPTALLTRILQEAVTAHEPPLVRGRRIKLKYAHFGGILPMRIIIHGNQTHALSQPYQRYLINTFRKALKLVGTPIELILKNSDNPYQPD